MKTLVLYGPKAKQEWLALLTCLKNHVFLLKSHLRIWSFRVHEMISTSPLSLLPDLSWVSPNCLIAFEMTHQLMDPPVAASHPRQMWRKSKLAQERGGCTRCGPTTPNCPENNGTRQTDICQRLRAHFRFRLQCSVYTVRLKAELGLRS